MYPEKMRTNRDEDVARPAGVAAVVYVPVAAELTAFLHETMAVADLDGEEDIERWDGLS